MILEFDPSRGQDPVRRRLASFSGTIQTDGYEVYDALRAAATQHRAHRVFGPARRDIYQAVRENLAEAVWFITRIRQLYRIEDGIRAFLPPSGMQAAGGAGDLVGHEDPGRGAYDPTCPRAHWVKRFITF